MSLMKVQSNEDEIDRQLSEMSLKSFEDNYRRDSFEDRICDDLCQHILQYLPLKARLRLECVSKQFQRTVFLSTCPRSLEFQVFADYLLFNAKMIRYYESLKQLLKKFPKINKIRFEFYKNDPIYRSVAMLFSEMITKNCHNLTHFSLYQTNLIGFEPQKEFFDKFGHQLISVNFNFNSTEISSQIFFTFINIEELTVFSFDPQLSQIKFKRLKKFVVSALLYEEQLDSFVIFIENHTKTLKHLEVRGSDFEYLSHKLLEVIGKSINLVHLLFDVIIDITDKSVINYCKKIAINCKQIKNLELNIEEYKNLTSNEDMFSILKLFKQLKRLEFWFLDIPSSDDFYPFKDLKVLEKLSHFVVNCYEDTKDEEIVEETFLTDIDINFPKLKSLRANFPLIASEYTAQILSRLTSLETIALNITNDEIRPQIERQLKQNCRKFKSFKGYYSND